jgi:signal transduction histidine kinase
MLQTETEIIIFIVLSGILAALFIAGIIYFLVQFQKKKIRYEQDKRLLEEQHKQALLSSQLEVQTQTMRDIGREIHDNVGQKLTLASLYAQQLGAENEYPAIQQRMNSVAQIINESLTELRSLSKSLTSAHVADTPLHELLQHECDKITATGRYQLQLVLNEMPALSATVKTIVLRMAQEFFQNSMKHAGATTLAVSLQQTAEGIVLNMSDDGKGFNPQQTSQGIGLKNMQQRADIIEAQLSVITAPDKGTRLQLMVPQKSFHR